MKKIIFLMTLSCLGLLGSAQTINVDSIRIDSAIIASPTARYVYVRVFGMLSAGLPANVSLDYGISPSYNNLGFTVPTAVGIIGNSNYMITVTGLPVDSSVSLRAKIGGGNSSAFSDIFTFLNTGSPPCNYSASIFCSSDSFCEGSSFLLVALPPGGKYQWFKNNLILPVDTFQTLYTSLAGEYKVQVLLNNCLDSAFKEIKELLKPEINNFSFFNNTLIINGNFKLPIVVKVNNLNFFPVYFDSLQIILTGVAIGDMISVGYDNGCFEDFVIQFIGIQNSTKSQINQKEMPIFNLQGQKVDIPSGIYIQGRKKYLRL